MRHDDHTVPSPVRLFPLDRSRRVSRLVDVRVIDGNHEVDSFQVSSPETLQAAITPVLRHLPRGGEVRLTAVEEMRTLLGRRRVRKEAALPGVEHAIQFLAA